MAIISLSFVVTNISTVLNTFDTLKVYRSDADPLGPYVEITSVATRIPIVANQTVYAFEDLNGSNTSWYQCSYYNSTTTLESSRSDAQQGNGDPALTIVSAAALRANYLNGLDMTTPTGEPFPDSFYEFYIKSACSWLEHKLDIPIRTLAVVDERHDFYREDFMHWGHVQLYHYPSISVQQVRYVLPGEQLLLVVPDTWIHLNQDTGLLQVVPGGMYNQTTPTLQGSLLPSIQLHRYIPDVIRVDYTAGFSKGVPSDLVDLIGKIASFGPLNIAGDYIHGLGISSLSVGIDGLSQSIGTTTSQSSGGYGGRLSQYAKEVQEQFDVVRRYYKGFGMHVA